MVASALLLAGTAWYLRGSTAPAWPTASVDTLCLASWNVSSQAGGGPAPDALADAIEGLGVDVIALQGLASQDHAQALAESLGPLWGYEAVPGPRGGYLAVFWRPGMKVVSYHLLGRPGDDALAVRLRDEQGRHYLIVSLQPGPADDTLGGPGSLQSVLDWCATHPAGLIVLAGPVDLQHHPAELLGQEYIGVGDPSPSGSRAHIAPSTAEVIQAGVLEGAVSSGSGGLPLLVEIAPS